MPSAPIPTAKQTQMMRTRMRSLDMRATEAFSAAAASADTDWSWEAVQGLLTAVKRHEAGYAAHFELAHALRQLGDEMQIKIWLMGPVSPTDSRLRIHAGSAELLELLA